MSNVRMFTKVAAVSSLIIGTLASSAMAIPVSQAVQKSQSTTLLAQAVDKDSNLKFESRGCYRTKNTTVICDVLVTNLGDTRPKIRWGATQTYKPLTNVIDSSGTVYATNELNAGGSSTNYYVDQTFAPSVPTKVSFVFDIPTEVTEITAVDVGYLLWINSNQTVPKQIALTNIGTIASKPKSPSTATPRR